VASLFCFDRYDVHVANRRLYGISIAGLFSALLFGAVAVNMAAVPAGEKAVWKPVQFAIVRFNGEAPQAWNIYHYEKRDNLLVKIWKRYLYLDLKEGEVYEVDPQTVKPQGDDVEWSLSDLPNDPIEINEWKSRDAGRVRSIKFRFGKNGHTLEVEIPLQLNGKPAY
jgi:hypothetical protein